MNWVILLGMLIGASAGYAHNDLYYYLHPVKLQKELNACTKQVSETKNCGQLKKVAAELNQAAYELSRNPQYFGKQILDLQETIAKQKSALKNNPNQPDLAVSLKQNQQQLREKLAIVKWLESPES